jgi:hypothetical protein
MPTRLTPRRFPPSWSIEEHDESFIVHDGPQTFAMTLHAMVIERLEAPVGPQCSDSKNRLGNNGGEQMTLEEIVRRITVRQEAREKFEAVLDELDRPPPGPPIKRRKVR